MLQIRFMDFIAALILQMRGNHQVLELIRISKLEGELKQEIGVKGLHNHNRKDRIHAGIYRCLPSQQTYRCLTTINHGFSKCHHRSLVAAQGVELVANPQVKVRIHNNLRQQTEKTANFIEVFILTETGLIVISLGCWKEM